MERTPLYGSVELADEGPGGLMADEVPLLKAGRRKDRMPQTHILAVVLSVLALMLGGALVIVEQHDPERSRSSTAAPLRLRSSLFGTSRLDSSELSLEFEVENNYGKHTYLESEYPWLNGLKLIEPNKPTTIRILEPDDSVSYVWEFYYDDLRVGLYMGSEVSMMLPGVGKYVVYVRAVDDDKSTLASSKETVYCKYVKREIRQLTTEDREAFFTAARVLWSTTTEEGQKLYGPDYMDIMYFTSYHLTYAAQRNCDHMHDGVGFFTQHAALTMKFEKSMQAVDPAVSLPYWDFTIDTQEILLNHHEQYSKFWFETTMFTDDYFGRVDPDLHTVTTGRWAYLEVPKSNVSVKNAYGLMRSPWNTNKNKYLTRYSTFCGTEWVGSSPTFPTCEVHYNSITAYNTWEDFAWEILYSPHGPMHAIMGGVFGCDSAFQGMKNLGLSDKFVYWFSIWSFGNARKFYRFGFYDCPTDCSDDTAQEDCMCSCSGLDRKLEMGQRETLIKTAVDKDPYQSEVLALDEDSQVKFLELICNANLLLGDNIEAASPFDPTFWPLHPTIERLWQVKKLRSMFTDETWPTSGLSTYQDTCSGHSSESVIPLEGLFEPETYMTNEELYAKMDPTSDAMPYIFADFEWEHCKDYGVDFGSMEIGVTVGDGSTGDDDAA